MPKIISQSSQSLSGFLPRSAKTSQFPVPSKECQRQRALFENTATPTGAGLVLNAQNQGPFKKAAFPACQQ